MIQIQADGRPFIPSQVVKMQATAHIWRNEFKFLATFFRLRYSALHNAQNFSIGLAFGTLGALSFFLTKSIFLDAKYS